MKKVRWGLMLGLLFLLTGCTAVEGSGTPLAFEPHLRVSPEGKAEVVLGIHNISGTGMPAQANFDGGFRIERVQDGQSMVEIPFSSVDRLGPGQEAFPLGWEGELEPGEYHLIWGAPHFGATEMQFTVREGEWTVVDVELYTRGLDFDWPFDETE